MVSFGPAPPGGGGGGGAGLAKVSADIYNIRIEKKNVKFPIKSHLVAQKN